MKRLTFIAVTLISVFTFLLMSVSAAVSTAIANGGFEGTEIGNIYANDGQTVLSISTEQKYSGKSSLKNSSRTNNYGALAVDVTEYIKNCGSGEYYCSFRILGTFDASVRATLHTTHEDGGDFYRQVGSLTEFKKGEWTLVGYGADNKPLPLRIENWNEEDITKWDSHVSSNVRNATLYLWIEGDTENDFYIDELNFWGVNDTPVSFVSSPDTSDSFAVGIVMIVSAAAAAVAVSKVKKHK